MELTQHVSETISQVSEQDDGETTRRRNDRKPLVWHSGKKNTFSKDKITFSKNGAHGKFNLA